MMEILTSQGIARLATDPAVWAQIAIAVFGLGAVALSQSVHERRRRWACVAGLIGQPAWFYSAVSTHQWGIFVLSLAFTAVWAKGFVQFWLAPWLSDRKVRL